MPVQHLVLDRRPQRMPRQHVVARAVVVPDQLHLPPRLHGRRRLGVLAVRPRHVQARQRQRGVRHVPRRRLLPPGFGHTHRVPHRQQHVARGRHRRQPVPVRPRVLRRAVQPVPGGLLLPRRQPHHVRVPQPRLHGRGRHLQRPVHVPRQLGAQRVQHLRVRRRLPAHSGCLVARRLALRRVPRQRVLHGGRRQPVPLRVDRAPAVGQLHGLRMRGAQVHDRQPGDLAADPQLRPLRRQPVLHLQHAVRNVPRELDVAHRHGQRLRLHLQQRHVRGERGDAERPPVQRVPARVLLRGRDVGAVPRQRLLPCGRDAAHTMPRALDRAEVLERVDRL